MKTLIPLGTVGGISQARVHGEWEPGALLVLVAAFEGTAKLLVGCDWGARRSLLESQGGKSQSGPGGPGGDKARHPPHHPTPPHPTHPLRMGCLKKCWGGKVVKTNSRWGKGKLRGGQKGFNVFECYVGKKLRRQQETCFEAEAGQKRNTEKL